MKLRSLVLSCIIVLASFFGVTSSVFAQNRVSTAAERCGLSQSYLKNILKNRDLYGRVDRLQAYQYIHQRIDVFARRLERNNQPSATEMRTSLTKLSSLIDAFKSDYESYDAAREAVINVPNCKNNLAQFQDKLAEARLKRDQVNADVESIKQVLQSEIVIQLESVHKSFNSGGAQ